MTRSPRELLVLGCAFFTSAALVIAACGGKAVVDGEPPASGSDGGGGSGGSPATTGTASSSSTGGATCNCQRFCSFVEPCGFLGVECLTLCNSGIDAPFLQCVCNSGGNCQTISDCGFGGTTVSAGSGGGTLAGPCLGCLQNAAGSACVPELDQCLADVECDALGECVFVCGGTAPCIDGCEAQHPQGVAAFATFMECSLCNSCELECGASDAANHYCN